METEEKIRLKKLYAEMPDEGLIDMLLEGKDAYQKDVYDLLIIEAQQRGLEEKVSEIRRGAEKIEELKSTKPEEFQQIFQTYNNSDIAFLRSLLQANNIDFIVENENFNMVRPISGVPIIFKVNGKQVNEAKELLKDFQGGIFGQGKVD